MFVSDLLIFSTNFSASFSTSIEFIFKTTSPLVSPPFSAGLSFCTASISVEGLFSIYFNAIPV